VPASFRHWLILMG